jgi:hypothetical protein
MVAGAHGDDAAAALGRAERKQLVQRAALLERGGELQVLELQEHFRSDEAGKCAAVHTGRLLDRSRDAPRGGADVFDRDRHSASLAAFVPELFARRPRAV